MNSAAVATTLPRALLDRAALPYRAGGRFAWHFARGKLGHDPAFAGILRLGLIPNDAQVLDLGCGQGVLAALLLAADDAAPARAGWPAAWPDPPAGAQVRGIELMPRDVQRARAAFAPRGERMRIEQGDIRDADFGRADVVVILDVLHYIDSDAQQQVLARVRDCLRPGGRLLLRVGDADAGWRFRFSNWVDSVVIAARTRALPRLHCRPLRQWRDALEQLGFEVEVLAMHAGTPFANMLLVARTAPAAEANCA